jgi:hypothetical protein
MTSYHQTPSKLYRIICLKRSILADGHYVWWRPNASGYTEVKYEAGLYTALELDECNGVEGDWYATRIEARDYL